jgi:hypothetical protein
MWLASFDNRQTWGNVGMIWAILARYPLVYRRFTPCHIAAMQALQSAKFQLARATLAILPISPLTLVNTP